jgi:hypothetical protein
MDSWWQRQRPWSMAMAKGTAHLHVL